MSREGGDELGERSHGGNAASLNELVSNVKMFYFPGEQTRIELYRSARQTLSEAPHKQRYMDTIKKFAASAIWRIQLRQTPHPNEEEEGNRTGPQACGVIKSMCVLPFSGRTTGQRAA